MDFCGVSCLFFSMCFLSFLMLLAWRFTSPTCHLQRVRIENHSVEKTWFGKRCCRSTNTPPLLVSDKNVRSFMGENPCLRSVQHVNLLFGMNCEASIHGQQKRDDNFPTNQRTPGKDCWYTHIRIYSAIETCQDYRDLKFHDLCIFIPLLASKSAMMSDTQKSNPVPVSSDLGRVQHISGPGNPADSGIKCPSSRPIFRGTPISEVLYHPIFSLVSISSIQYVYQSYHPSRCIPWYSMNVH